MLQYLPNSLTCMRLLLAVPLSVMILRSDFNAALIIGMIAGATDILDGFFARRLGAMSRFGAALDPIADKVLIMAIFICLAAIALVPWYLTVAVILRDLIIVAGAACYHRLIGPFEFEATRLSKANMFIQISFCVMILLMQIVDWIPNIAILIGIVAVLFIAAASGFDYVMSWTIKALQSSKNKTSTNSDID
ncbi:MAG: CDP-alcohol phosphatidyltransferase family protein [Halioglobus sp.]|nr:CDP-alcohol phosphatidyltransferase family protein [Halioglobus sp.]